MSKYLVSSITIKNELKYSTNLLDGFCSVHIYVPASTQLSAQALHLLNTNSNTNIVSTNSYKKNKELVLSYVEAVLQANMTIIIETIKNNTDITLKSCTKKWCSYKIPIDTLSNSVKCEFKIAEEYQSELGTPPAYEKFKTIKGGLPDFTKISKAYTAHDDAILNIEFQ